ncbi:hypothetical protein [Novosphingobium beihaiensis]|uniref:Glycosyltransferase RgtA/B/C/D-like domain-containing protein n=1 Tax=Novosphingobium beihaiensis TaxID=2930389 RepID=A0ABT0BV55_9SPHN|nr:hypothetical protein [Novosphingobium beihaiensis]MCJ2188865.1 hypothetical protein [Novosphingobium beihaiensis]
MKRPAFLIPTVWIAALTALLLAALLEAANRGYVSTSNMDLWGRTLLASSGELSIQKVVTAFPPLPYATVLAIHGAVPGLDFAAPQLLSALIASLLVWGWYRTLRESGFSLRPAILAVLLLAGSPLYLRAVAEGPGFMMLLAGFWLFALGMFQLRRGHRVNDIILVSTGLVITGFSHPFGLMLVLGVLPFLALAAPPDRLRTATLAVLLVLLFPLIFALASFIYVNWVFAGDGFYFLSHLSRETAGLGSSNVLFFDAGQMPGGIVPPLIAAMGVFAVSPIAISMFVLTARLPPLRLAAAGLIGHLVCTMFLAYMFGLLPPIAAAASLGLPLAAATSARWPQPRPHRSGVIIMLLAGFIGSWLIAATDPASETVRWRAALTGAPVPSTDPELDALAAHTQHKDSVLFDAEAAPAVIALRGNAQGIWSADTTQFRIAALSKTIDARMIVVRNPHSALGGGRVARNFPRLYDEGHPGYHRLFDSGRWRIYVASEGERQ